MTRNVPARTFLLASAIGILLAVVGCSDDSPNEPGSDWTDVLVVTPSKLLIPVSDSASLSAIVDSVRCPTHKLIWDFADGTPPDTTTATEMVHHFKSAGQFSVLVHLVDTTQGGIIATSVVPVLVWETPFAVVIEPDTLLAHCNNPFYFTAHQTAGALTGDRVFKWDFGDGNPLPLQVESDTCTASATIEEAGWFPVVVWLESAFLPDIPLASDTAWVQTAFATRLDSSKYAKISISGRFEYLTTVTGSQPQQHTEKSFSATFPGYRKFPGYTRKPFPWDSNNRCDIFSSPSLTSNIHYYLRTQIAPDWSVVDTIYIGEWHHWGEGRFEFTDGDIWTRITVRGIPICQKGFPQAAVYTLKGKAASAAIEEIFYHKETSEPTLNSRTYTRESLIAWTVGPADSITVTFK